MEQKDQFDRDVLVNRVRLCLMATGETLESFGRSVGLSQSSAYRIFNGERTSEATWTKLVRHLGYDPRVSLKDPAKRFIEAIAMVGG